MPKSYLMGSHSSQFKDIIIVISLGTLVFFGALFIFVSIKQENRAQNQSLKEADVILDQRINSRISAIEAKLKIKKRRASVSGSANYDSVDQSSRLSKELEIYKTVEAEKKEARGILDQTIEMVDKENESEAERRAYIESYKKEYMKRARMDGWEVKLNDDLEVVSARKIKPKKQ